MTKWKVNIWESERGWGRRLDSTRTFDDYDEAKNLVKEYNDQNDKDIVPDWYMFASGPYPVE